MRRGRPNPLGKNRVSIRVLLSKEDYSELVKIAELERTDISTILVYGIGSNGKSSTIRMCTGQRKIASPY